MLSFLNRSPGHRWSVIFAVTPRVITSLKTINEFHIREFLLNLPTNPTFSLLQIQTRAVLQEQSNKIPDM